MRLNHHVDHAATPTHPGRRQGERGYVMTMFALLLVPLLLMAGFAVDVGSWYSRTSDMQKAADAAALAGVVWLPDLDEARTVALDVAKRNGFDNADSNISITVEKSAVAPRRLVVRIRDTTVGSFFYEGVGGSDLDLSRTSFAEYTTPIPLGSPRNFFGLGSVLDRYTATGMTPEFLYQSVNPYCTDKVNGDRYQSGFNGTCSGSANGEYRSEGYSMYIEAKEGRTSDIEVRLFDARYNEDNAGTPTCRPTFDRNYTTLSSTRTVYGEILYWNGSRWVELGVGESATARYVRYKNGETCTYPEPGIDDFRQSGNDDYTFTLYSADDTPLDDTDNPAVPGCTETFSHDTPFDGYAFLGSERWNTLCTISTTAPDGKYILRVSNQGSSSGNPENDGSNQWGLVARYTAATDDGLCDGRNDSMCPRVYGTDAISVKADSEATQASFYLAEIGPEHAGKKLRIELFDPGEGGNNLRIMAPTGPNSWAVAPVTWTSTGASPSSGSGTQIDVTGSRFNGRLLEITVDLTGYSPPAGGVNDWWQIEYNFTSGADVTDRTTWSAEILGDPVHLIEEN